MQYAAAFVVVPSNVSSTADVYQVSSDSDDKWLRYLKLNMVNIHTQIARTSKSQLPPTSKKIKISATTHDKFIKFEILPTYILVHIW